MIAELPRKTEDDLKFLVEAGVAADATAAIERAVGELVVRTMRRRQFEDLFRQSSEEIARGEHIPLTQQLLNEKWEAALRNYREISAKNDHAGSR